MRENKKSINWVAVLHAVIQGIISALTALGVASCTRIL